MRRIRRSTTRRIIAATSIVAFLMFGSLTTVAIGSYALVDGGSDIRDDDDVPTTPPEEATATPSTSPSAPASEIDEPEQPVGGETEDDFDGYASFENGKLILKGKDNNIRYVLDYIGENECEPYGVYGKEINGEMKTACFDGKFYFLSDAYKLDDVTPSTDAPSTDVPNTSSPEPTATPASNTTPVYYELPAAPTATPPVILEEDVPKGVVDKEEKVLAPGEDENKVPLSDAKEPTTPDENTTVVVNKEDKVPMSAATPDAVPETGDTMNPMLPIAGMGLSILAFLAAVNVRRKREE